MVQPLRQLIVGAMQQLRHAQDVTHVLLTLQPLHQQSKAAWQLLAPPLTDLGI